MIYSSSGRKEESDSLARGVRCVDGLHPVLHHHQHNADSGNNAAKDHENGPPNDQAVMRLCPKKEKKIK